MKVDVILPAAGRSERMKHPTSKQFIKVLHKHIIAYTVDCFHRCPWVRHIVIVVGPDCKDFTKQLMESYGFTKTIVCTGEETRHRSIYCGIKALRSECTDTDVVIIHDGARPIVPEDVALRVAQAAETHGAAGVTRNLVSTVIRGDEDQKLVESLDRRLYRNSEMPQAFRYSIISGAYQKCTDDDLDFGTECLLLAMKYSHCRAFLVEGTDDLWKVTYQKDVYSMESIIKKKLTVVSTLNYCSQQVPTIPALHSKLDLAEIKLVEDEEDSANTFVVFVDNHISLSQLLIMTSRICGCYKKMPFSAVGLNMLVILVFLTSSVRDGATTKSHDTDMKIQGNEDDKSICNTALPSHISSDGGDFTQLQTGTGRPEKHHNAKLNDQLFTCSSSNHHNTESVKSGAEGDVTVELNSHDSPATEQQLSGNLDHPGSIMYAPKFHSSNVTTHLSEQASQHRHSEQCRPQSGEMQQRHSTYTLLNYQTQLLQEMKERLKTEVEGKSALVVGVNSQAESLIEEQLAELIWQRSFVLDGQVLTL